MTAFSDYVQKQSATPTELPLVHTTDYHRLSSISATNFLEPHKCDVFREALLYLFYGRPAYRDSTKTRPMKDVGFYPICFVFHPGILARKIKRVYPFDTGASQDGFYKPTIMPADALVRYEVGAVPDSFRKIVAGFFGTDEQYLSSKPKAGLTFSLSEAHAQSYYTLINIGGGTPGCDDRKSAVEVQVATKIDVRRAVIAIALPNCFLDDKNLQKTLTKTWRAKLLPYDAVVGMRPLEFHGTIHYIVREFYRREGYLP